MSLTKDLLCGTVGGFAILAGTGYYFQRRKNPQIPTRFERFKQLFTETKVEHLLSFQLEFDVLYHHEVGQYIKNLELMVQEEQNEEKGKLKQRQSYCGKQIRYGYRCYDCYPDSQFAKEDIAPFKSKECSEAMFLHSFCEDCFDEKIHQGHTYVSETYLFQTFCECGQSSVLKESSFCADHCESKNLNLKQEHFSVEIKQKLGSFFDNLFAFLIDISHSHQLSQKALLKKESHSSRFKILLSLTQNLILSLIKENFTYVQFFSEYFSKINKSSSTFIASPKQKILDTSKTPLDDLFVLIPQMNHISINLFMQICIELGSRNSDFYTDLTSKFFKHSKIIHCLFVELKNSPNLKKQMAIANLFKICLNGNRTDKSRQKVILENQLDVLNLMKTFTLLTQTYLYNLEYSPMMLMLLNYYNIASSVFLFPSIFQNYKYCSELISEYLKILVFYFNSSQLGQIKNKINFATDFLIRNSSIFNYSLGQQLLFGIIFEFTKKLLQCNNKDLSDQIKKTLSEVYVIQVNRIYEAITVYESKSGSPRFNLGVNLLEIIICILLLEQQPFNRDGFKTAIKNNFPLIQTDKEICDFADKVLFILRRYAPHETQTLEKELPTFAVLLNIMANYSGEEWKSQASTFWEYSNYDLYILTYQVFYLLGSQLKRSVTDEASDTKIFRSKLKFFSYQVIFDQTPFINYIYDSDKGPLLVDESIQKNIKQAIQSTILGIIHTQPSSASCSLKQLRQQTDQFLSNQMVIKRELAILCDIKEEKNSFKLKNKLSDIFHIFNQGRMISLVETPYSEYFQKNLDYMTKNKKFYIDLFDYQKQLLIKEYSNFCFFQEILESLNNSDVLLTMEILGVESDKISICEVLIEMAHENKGLFTEQEYQDTLRIEKELYSEKWMKIILQKYKEYINELERKQEPQEDILLFFTSFYSIYQTKYNKTIDFLSFQHLKNHF